MKTMNFMLGGYNWEIIEQGESEEVYINKGEDMRIGLCDYVKQKIYIHCDLTPELKRRTLAHELTHACLFSHGLEGFFDNEELLCNFVARYVRIMSDVIYSYFESE